jgi:hypothetical protein
MPHPAQRSTPIQVAVHIIVGRVEPPRDRQRHTPRMVQVITVRHPQPQASLLVHRASHLHSRYIYICIMAHLLLCYVTGYFLHKYRLIFNPFKPRIHLNNLYVTDLTREVTVYQFVVT